MLPSVEMVTFVSLVPSLLPLGVVSKVNSAQLVRVAKDWSKDPKFALKRLTTQMKVDLLASTALPDVFAWTLITPVPPQLTAMVQLSKMQMQQMLPELCLQIAQKDTIAQPLMPHRTQLP
jgi:hypothetical protein